MGYRSWRVRDDARGSVVLEHGAGDFALEAFKRLRHRLDVFGLAAVTASDQDRGADARSDDVGVGVFQRRRRIVDDDAIVALRVLRQIEKLLGAEKLLGMGRGRAGDE